MLQDATIYPVDHLNEHATSEDHINRFTEKQGHDDIMVVFRQMLRENTTEITPQQQNTDGNLLQATHIADSKNQPSQQTSANKQPHAPLTDRINIQHTAVSTRIRFSKKKKKIILDQKNLLLLLQTKTSSKRLPINSHMPQMQPASSFDISRRSTTTAPKAIACLYQLTPSLSTIDSPTSPQTHGRVHISTLARSQVIQAI